MKNKRILKIGTLLITITAILIAFTTISSAANWPMFRNNAGNTGSINETIHLPLTEQWHSSAPSVEESGAVVVNGVAYMSTDNNQLYAFDVATGATIPGFPVTIGFSYGSLAVDEAHNLVYALTQDGVLYAYHLNGTSAWTKAVGAVGYNYNEGPIIDDGYVYFKAGNLLQKYNANVFLQWTAPTAGMNTQPSIMGNFVYVNSESGQIRKYNKTTGAEITTGGFPISTEYGSAALTTVDGKIFTKGTNVLAYDANTGNLLWSQPCGGSSTWSDSPAVSNGVVYIYGYDDSKMYAFSENNGSTMAGFPSIALNPGGDRNWCSPAVAGDKIFIGAGTSQKLKVLGAAGSANAGQVLEEHLTFSSDPQGFDLCSPIISNGVVFAMLDGGGLYALFGSGVNWSGGAIIINNGENCTGSRNVTLTLSNGSIPNVVQMRISEDPLFSGVSWEPFATTKVWTLSPGLGLKTVYAQFKDSIGQLSNVFNDQINYSENCGAVIDTIPPITTKTIGTPQYANGLWVNMSTPITLTATDPGANASGVKEIHYKINGIETIVQGSQVTFTFQEECNHTLEFWAVDNAGNIGNHTTQTHYVDNTGPNQTTQFGEPKNITFVLHNNVWYTGIGPNTPIWINSTDMGCNGGVGSSYLSYNLYIGQQFGEWTLHTSHTIYDNQAGDMNPAVGKISVVLYMDESCWHQIHYWCADLLGNRAPEPQGSYLNSDFVVDATAPTTQVTYTTPHMVINNDDYISCETEIIVCAFDTGCVPNGSGVMKLDWSVDKKLYDDVWQTVQSGTVYDNDGNDLDPTVGKIKFIIYMTESCEHHIYTQATDYFGNIGPQDKRYVKVDCTPPVTTKEIGEPKYYDSSEDITYVTTSTPIWLNTTDQPGVCAVGCDYLHWETYIYNESSQGWDLLQSNNESSNKAVIYFTEECHHKLVWWAIDKFGNKEETHVQFHNVDDTPPTTIKEYGYPKCLREDFKLTIEPPICITSHTPIYLNATDGGLCPVGSYIIYYRVWYNGQWSAWLHGGQTTDVVITMNDLGAPFNQDCEHFINYYAVDDLMNTEEIHNQTFYVDNTPPVIVKTVGEPNCTIDEDEYCILPTTPITIDAYNDGCCADTGLMLRYKINDGDWIYPTLPVEITIPEECQHILTIEAWDCLGNTATDVETFYVHITPPTIIKTVGNPHCDKGNGTYCVTMQTPITVEATDEGCGQCGPITIQYNIGYNNNWTGWLNYTGPIMFSEPCEHTLIIRAYDCLDNGINEQYWDFETFYVDNTTPVIEKTVGEPQCDLGNGTYCVTTTTPITINAYDLGCCDSLTVKYRINQGDWVDITSLMPFTFNFTEECQHVLDIWAYDCVGHETMDTETFYVDDTPPIINKTVGEPNCYCGNDTESHYCVTTQTPITITAINAGCCPCPNSTIEYRIWFDGQWTDWIPYNGSFTFQEECTHKLEIRAMDCLENTATDLETFYVDDTPPELVKTVGNPHVYLGVDYAGHDQWLIYPLTDITLSAQDFGCCPCNETTIYYRYWYLGHWTGWIVYQDPINFHKGCVHYLEAYAVDCLGNQGITDNETFWVCSNEGTGPYISFVNPVNGSVHCERTLEVIINATDDLTHTKDLIVKIWMPGGRRNAPSFYYDGIYNATDGFFHAWIDIHEYQDGAQLTLEACVKDTDNNVQFAVPVTFEVCSNVAYDQWMELGWNSLVIPYGGISCDFTLPDALGSIKGNFNWVWYYDVVHDQWFSWYKNRDPSFNTLTMIDPGKQYWVYMEKADRYFTDTNSPMVTIIYPKDGAIFNTTTITVINGTAFDNETGIDHVTITLYNNDTGKYWNGTAWGTTATALLCTGTETWSYEASSVAWVGGHFIVTATAFDKVGCSAEDTHTFTIISQNCTSSRTYTLDKDFDEGTLIGLSHNIVHDQLQIIPGEVTTYPVMWIANAGEDSLSKWDTNQNKELARYHTWFGPLASHDPWSGPAPSRTCVDADGNCYVANRHFDGLPADVIKIYADNWIDRNGDGKLNTSTDLNNDGTITPNEMLPMTDLNNNQKIDPNEIVDERVAWAVTVGEPGGLGRSIAIDLEGNIWVGLYNAEQYWKISGANGSILGGPYYVAPHTPYGALVDKHGYLWGASLSSNILKLNTSNPADYQIFYGAYTYGIALGYDSLGNTLVYLGDNSPFAVFNSSTGTYSYPAPAILSSLGVATDSKGNIVAGDSYNGLVAKFAPNGTVLWSVPGQVTSEVRGIVVDSEDNVWAIHLYDSKLAKYNGTNGAYMGVFNSGYEPYTYSDATGLGFRGSISVGTWDVIFDTKADNTKFNKVSWNSLQPNGTTFEVKVRSSPDQNAWSPWEIASNGAALSSTPDGRYLEIMVTMQMPVGGTSPILYDLTVDGTCASCTDSNPPIVNILDPLDGEMRTSSPSQLNIEAYDEESSVVDVYVKIHDATTNLFFNETGWQDSEAWLFCTSDINDQWYLDTDWSDELNHTYHITAEAYDECGNIGTDMHTFTIIAEELTFSISGTIYYTGEENGTLTIALFDQNPEDINVTPIVTMDVQESYEFPVGYTFNNVPDYGAYYVAAHIDMNDNGGPPDPNEPQGFAINKTTSQPADPLIIASANVSGADVTLAIPPMNNPPNVPSDPTPANGSTNIFLNTTLSWTGGDPDVGDTVTYDVYFGNTSSPPLVSINQSATTYNPGALMMNTTYYWQIIARDNHGATTPGPLWSFTTLNAD